ncbi:MAG: CrcB family protein [Planctomycetota bacterium]|jgi:CrcB protein|nr:CrcB family protein [Planctomycetota bacterium]
MTQLLLIAAAGALGTVLRFAILQATSAWNESGFAWGTLIANVVGCFLIGLVLAYGHQRQMLNPNQLQLISVGFLGALTTFSTFTANTADLWRGGDFVAALAFAVANLVLGFALFYLGGILGRSV